MCRVMCACLLHAPQVIPCLARRASSTRASQEKWPRSFDSRSTSPSRADPPDRRLLPPPPNSRKMACKVLFTLLEVFGRATRLFALRAQVMSPRVRAPPCTLQIWPTPAGHHLRSALAGLWLRPPPPPNSRKMWPARFFFYFTSGVRPSLGPMAVSEHLRSYYIVYI